MRVWRWWTVIERTVGVRLRREHVHLDQPRSVTGNRTTTRILPVAYRATDALLGAPNTTANLLNRTHHQGQTPCVTDITTEAVRLAMV